MKFIGRVSTVNLADILPAGETKSGSPLYLPLSEPLRDGFLVSATFRKARLLYSRDYFLFLSTTSVSSRFLLVSAADDCQPNDCEKKLRAATRARLRERGCEVSDQGAHGSS